MKALHVLILIVALFATGCKQTEKKGWRKAENLEAKNRIQGIWVEENSEAPFMRIINDSITFADRNSRTLHFKIYGDTLYTYGADTTNYHIEKHTPFELRLRSITEQLITLHRPEGDVDSAFFFDKRPPLPYHSQRVERDSVVSYNGQRFRAYSYINPSTMKVLRTSYNEEGMSVENVYYDNVMHICVYQGREEFFATDLKKSDFAEKIPEEMLHQSVFKDIKFVAVNSEGFQYKATFNIPETYVYCVVKVTITHDRQLKISEPLAHNLTQ